jgi:hypothetical protein
MTDPTPPTADEPASATDAPDGPVLTWLQSPEIDQMLPALIKARATFTPLRKNTTNPHLNSQYANLAAVHDATINQLGENGLLLLQQMDGKDIFSRLFHTSGQWFGLRYPLSVGVNESGRTAAQSLGSAITYARRYSALLLLGLAPEDDDDDGNSAGRPGGGGNGQRPQPEEAPGDVQAYNEHAAAIAAAASLDALMKIGQTIPADGRLNNGQRRGLKAVYDQRIAELKAATPAQPDQPPAEPAKPTATAEAAPTEAPAADGTDPAPPAATKAAPAASSGPEPVADRKAKANDSARRRGMLKAAKEAHQGTLQGAGLAIGLLITGEDDEQYLTGDECDQMRKVTVEQAEEAVIAWAATQ